MFEQIHSKPAHMISIYMVNYISFFSFLSGLYLSFFFPVFFFLHQLSWLQLCVVNNTQMLCFAEQNNNKNCAHEIDSPYVSPVILVKVVWRCMTDGVLIKNKFVEFNNNNNCIRYLYLKWEYQTVNELIQIDIQLPSFTVTRITEG